MGEELEYNVVHTFGFNASHFFYGFKMKEGLHGHNFMLTVHVNTPDVLVSDRLESALKLLCNSMNDKVLLADSSLYQLEEEDCRLRITQGDGSYYEFPKKDCYVIREPNCSAECLARHAFEVLKSQLGTTWEKAMITVAEIFRQQEAIYRVINKLTSP
jgi:6-pyruvoyl-tetrahydropterin synthase